MDVHCMCEGTCEGVNDKPKKCDNKNCAKQDEMLEPCSCEDGKNQGRQTHDTEGESSAAGEFEDHAK